MHPTITKELAAILKEVRTRLSEQQMAPESMSPIAAPAPKKKPKKVIFDKSTGAPFEVVFSERGFLIDNTRFSFEDIETALSKEYNIVLQNGKGLQLDAVKMQKILKWKNVE